MIALVRIGLALIVLKIGFTLRWRGAVEKSNNGDI
jgi:hypothetical protein